MLSSRQIELLKALVNRLIPPDEAPGGWEAGVGDYLRRQFEHDLKPLLPIYSLALDALDQEAQAVYREGFDGLSAEEQDMLLTQIEIGNIHIPWPVDPRAFFQAAASHCAEGYYSDPHNGGNHNSVSWQMIGFQVRG